MPFKEVHCRDCTTILARYNLKYFTDSKIVELTRLYYQAHIKSGHALITRTTEDLQQDTGKEADKLEIQKGLV